MGDQQYLREKERERQKYRERNRELERGGERHVADIVGRGTVLKSCRHGFKSWHLTQQLCNIVQTKSTVISVRWCE